MSKTIHVIDGTASIVTSYFNHIYSRTSTSSGPDYTIINKNMSKDIRNRAWLSLESKIKNSNESYIGFDSTDGNWKSTYFSNYKYNTNLNKINSSFHWAKFYESLAAIVEELICVFPAYSMQCSKLSAFDIIYLSLNEIRENCKNDPYTNYKIIGGEEFISYMDPECPYYLKNCNVYSVINIPHKVDIGRHVYIERIMKGDEKLSIPNIYSSEDFYLEKEKSVKKIKQPSITQKMINTYTDWYSQGQWEMVKRSEVKNNYINRNLTLLDPEYIPSIHRENFLKVWEKQQTNTQYKLQKKEKWIPVFKTMYDIGSV